MCVSVCLSLSDRQTDRQTDRQNWYVPVAFKQAKVIPLFKSGKSSDPSNYRPISVLSALSKSFEKHINKHMLAHFNKNILLHLTSQGSEKITHVTLL